MKEVFAQFDRCRQIDREPAHPTIVYSMGLRKQRGPRFLDRIDLVAFESSFLRGDFDLIAPGVDGLLGAAEAAL